MYKRRISVCRHIRREMTVSEHTPNVESLVEEIEGYLSAIELFRAEGHEPRWRADPVAVAPARARSPGYKS